MEALIPGPKVVEAYTHRTLPGGWQDFDYFDSAFRQAHNVIMVGPTGSGKTTAPRAYAGARGLPFVSVEFNGALDPASTLGATLVDTASGLPQWKDGEITLAVRYGGVIMLDEVNFAPPRFTAAFHGVLDARQNLYISELGTRVPKSPDCLIFAAYNKKYVGTTMLNEAFLNRFAFPIGWEYDPDVEDERIGAYCPTLLKRVRQLRAEADITGDIGTNTMEEFIHIAHDLNIEAALYLFLNKLDDDDRAIAKEVLEAEVVTMAAEMGL